MNGPALYEWLVLLIALAALVWLAIENARVKKREMGQKSEHGFGTFSRPQRVVNGAGFTLPYGFVWLEIALIALAIGLLSVELFPAPWWSGLLIAVFIAVILWSVLANTAQKRAVRFEEKLIDATELMIATLQSGETPKNALRSVAHHGDPPVRSQFKALVSLLDVGVEIQRALRPIVLGYDSEGLRLFANTMVAKSTMGGDLEPILFSLNKVLRERQEHRLRMTSQMSGAKLASLGIAASPYVILVFYVFEKPDWIERVFASPLGTALFVAAVFIQMMGFLWLGRLTRLES
jgi:tight adherence protein B